MPNGLLLVISGPSGAGKSTLSRALLKKRPHLWYSVSATTRPARPGEVNGREYIFLPEAEFKKQAETGAFVEWARVHDHLYGTPRGPLVENTRQGRDVLLDLDPQGAMAIKKAFPGSVCVYICPPSWDTLEGRLRGRAQDDEDVIAKRLSNARKEVTYLERYDYLVVNDDVTEAVEDLSAILRAEHRRVERLEHRAGVLEEEKA